MENRISTKPHRYAVYDDNHVLVGYQYHERADEPTQVGTPLNKASLLTDTTCTALGIPTTSVPDDAWGGVINVAKSYANTKIGIETGSYIGTGSFGSSGGVRIDFQHVPQWFAILGYSEQGAYSPFEINYKEGRTPLINVEKMNNLDSTKFNYTGQISYYYYLYKKFAATETWLRINSYDSAARQCNISGKKYYWMALYSAESGN